MKRLLWASHVPRSCMAAVVVLAALTPAYAPPALRAPPRPVEVKPHDESGRRNDEKQPGTPGSNRVARQYKGWNLNAAKEAHPVSDALRPSLYLALLDIVRANPLWSRIDISSWRLAKGSGGAEEVYRVLELTDQSLPPPELAVFLDPILFKGARTGIATAWSGRGPYVDMPVEASLLENFLESYSGTTLLLVGHVEADEFVMRNADGKRAGSYSIPDLVSAARTHNVLLVPIGCRTGEAGAPIGFMQDISTDQVQAFLRAIPPAGLTVGDLLVALQTIAPLHIDVSATREALEIAVFAPGNDNPSVRVQVPNRCCSPRIRRPQPYRTLRRARPSHPSSRYWRRALGATPGTISPGVGFPFLASWFLPQGAI
jgi:hypothetical protein